jgi:hypothetical protein
MTIDAEGMHSKSALVTGRMYGADYVVPTPAVLTQSVLNMEAAYTEASLRTTDDPGRINLLGGDIGGQTLTPGVYTFTTAINIYSDIVFDGGEDDVFIMQTTGVLTLAASTKVRLGGEAQAKNIFWQVAGNAAIGASSIMQGVLLVKTDIAILTGAALTGRALSQTAVNLFKGALVTEAKVDVTVGPLQEWISLGAACDYAVLSKSGITNIGPSMVTGDMGTSPITGAAITGFALALSADGQHSTSEQCSGEVHAASYGGEIAASLTISILAMQAAYTNAASRTNFDETRKNVGNGNIGGQVLTPGVYTFDRAIVITSDVTFKGDENSVFIVQSTGVLSSAVGAKVLLEGGAQAKNIIWQIAGNCAFEVDSQIQGIILTKTYAAFKAGATLTGSVMAQTAVTLDKNTITMAPGTCRAETNYVDPALAVADDVAAAASGSAAAASGSTASTVSSASTAGPQAPVDIGSASNYAVLAKDSISTSPTSTITGNIGLSPAVSSAITGFGLSPLGQSAEASQVSGQVFAADYSAPTPLELTTAVNEMEAAYADAAGRDNPDDARINPGGGGDIGGMNLTPGVYTFTAGVNINLDITFEGGPNDIFIIQINGPLTLANDMEVTLGGNVNPDNIFWQVAGPVVVGSDASMQGVILAKDDVLFKGGSQLEGRILGQKNVELNMAVIGTMEAFCT